MIPFMLLVLLAAAAPNLEVPLTGPATIDGRISPGEWDNAYRTSAADGTTILLMHDGAHLYIAIEGASELLGSVCIASGVRVQVLHASMALARAEYVHSTEGWRLATPFAYAMREADFSPGTLELRAAYLRTHGWLANTTPMGDPGVREYRVALDAETPVRLAVAYLRTAGGAHDVGVWPGADAACGAMDLVMGNTPEPLAFEPSAWPVLELAR